MAHNDTLLRDVTSLSPRKRRRSGDYTMTSSVNGPRSLFNSAADCTPEEGESSELDDSAKAKLADENVAPFLARHIPSQYAPMGLRADEMVQQPPSSVNSKFCYRHRPDLKCRRQVDEPSMDQLQRVR
jgi:F-box/WD-40 domain protein MET30